MLVKASLSIAPQLAWDALPLGIPESTDDDPLHGTRVLAQRVADSDPAALHAVRQAATEVGEVVAVLVHMFNPRSIILAGPLSELRDDLVSAVRAAVYQRALPLATRKLTITANSSRAAPGSTVGSPSPRGTSSGRRASHGC
ncbi:ROK family protein [Streptomyces niphimycinicus]|uniref:ROK family protein n=1 Tax=Streptomyces niphimycinicus TaxID=2842201 RepID=UPI00209A9CC5|nr:ROK family protein [Streptomyces niphimycinicus]